MDKYKTCTQCLANKPFADFPSNPQNKTTGLHSKCRACRRNQYKEYSQINKAVIAQKRAIYNLQNREIILEKKRQNYRSNKSKIRQQNSAWEKQNRHITSENTRRRRMRLKTITYYSITNKELIVLYNKQCFYCGIKSDITLDHVIPISRGGVHGIGNLVAACKSCNSSKNAKTIMEWRIWKIKNETISRSLS